MTDSSLAEIALSSPYFDEFDVDLYIAMLEIRLGIISPKSAVCPHRFRCVQVAVELLGLDWSNQIKPLPSVASTSSGGIHA